MTAKVPIAPAIPTLPPQDYLDGSQPCREVDPEVFFPSDGQSPRAARRICDGCEVREECYAWAVDAGIDYGVWGGVSMYTDHALSHAKAMQRLRARRGAAA